MNSVLEDSTIDSVPEFSLKGLTTKGKIVGVYDGDTCDINLIYKEEVLRFNCRLFGIDAPEMRPLKTKIGRDEEIKCAIKCRDRLIQLATNCVCACSTGDSKLQVKELLRTNTKIVDIKCYEFDKYGRLLVEIIDDGCICNDILISEGLAKKYDGGAKI